MGSADLTRAPLHPRTGEPWSAEDVLEAFESIEPGYGTRRMTLEDAVRLAEAFDARVFFPPLDAPGALIPPVGAGHASIMVSARLAPEVRAWVVLHELVHLVAHSWLGERCRAEERLCDLVAALGVTTAEERGDVEELRAILARLPRDEEWPSRFDELAEALR